METSSATIPQVVIGRVVRERVLVDMMLVIAASCLIALAAQVAVMVPFTLVPMTLQPVAVLLVGVTLGRNRGAAAAALYLFEGFSGLPVFAEGHGGPMWLLGATAGYLYSYPFAAGLVGWLSERGTTRSFLAALATMLLGVFVIYTGGFSWLAAIVGTRAAFAQGVAPFAIADVVKVVIAAAMLPQLQKLVTRTTA